MKRLFMMLLLMLTVMSCAVQNSLYYWGDYSHTLHNQIKEPTPENSAAHEEMLRKIIQESEELGKKVPPGIYFELGYILMQNGNVVQARELFSKEIEAYPESTPFVNNLLSTLKVKDGSHENN